MKAASEQGIDWFIFTVAISEKFRCAPNLVRDWPVSDIVDAHVVLETIDEIEQNIRTAEAMKRSK